MSAAAEGGGASRPLPSATVVVARDGSSGPELLLVLRHGRTSFGDSYVFPGGLLESRDREVFDRCDGLTPAAADSCLGVDGDGLAWYSAGIRELFEEAGVLLARDAAGGWADAERLAGFREPLNEGRLGWPEFLAKHELRLACSELRYFAFWITPREQGKRFSTRFFAARLPEGQAAAHCGRELVDSRWMSPGTALDLARDDQVSLPYPTRMTLESLRCCADATGVISWAEAECSGGVACRRPAVVRAGDERIVVMPGDERYPDYDSDSDHER